MTVYKCDRCGDLMEDHKEVYTITIYKGLFLGEGYNTLYGENQTKMKRRHKRNNMERRSRLQRFRFRKTGRKF